MKKLDKSFFAWEGALKEEQAGRKELRARQTYERQLATHMAYEAAFTASRDAADAEIKKKHANDVANGFNVASVKPIVKIKTVRFRPQQPQKDLAA